MTIMSRTSALPRPLLPTLLAAAIFVMPLTVVPKSESIPTTVSIMGKPETRCGWFENPTPGNASLSDRDGEWIIGVQGGYQASGNWPDFSDDEWVETNVHYGYGCACLTVTTDRRSHRILEIKGSRVRPPSTCKKDKRLKRP